MTPGELQAAGLYDPAAPNAADRLALLEWLAERGATVEQMVRAHAAHTLTGLAGDLALRAAPHLTAADVARRTGLEEAQVTAVALAAGIPAAPEAAAYTDEEVQLFANFARGSSFFGERSTLQFTRVVGSAVARIAEAAVSLFQVQVEGPLRGAGGGELALARENLRAVESLETVRGIMRVLFAVHVEKAIRRLRLARPRASVDTATLAIGFVDLVGFTSLSQSLSTAELAGLVERFEETAHDVVTAREGRVVKLVGDEVMFVAGDAGAACDIALTLLERFARDPAVTPRGGLAHGALLVRGGDYYGPVVNLAARVAELAVPNELLATPQVAAAADAGRVPLRFEQAGKRMLKGFAEPVALLAVSRGAADGATRTGS